MQQGHVSFIDVPAQAFRAIIDAVYRFGAGQDLNDHGILTSAFASNATLDFVQPARRLGVEIGVFVGRDFIVDTVMATTGQMTTTHTMTNARVTAFGGMSATLWLLVEAQHQPAGDSLRHLMLKNFYDVDLVIEDDAWVIQRLVITMVWHTGDPAVLFPPA